MGGPYGAAAHGVNGASSYQSLVRGDSFCLLKVEVELVYIGLSLSLSFCLQTNIHSEVVVRLIYLFLFLMEIGVQYHDINICTYVNMLSMPGKLCSTQNME